MINLLSYAGMSLQTEVCMWTLLGLIRTIFDATLFKVNANLKQVWQMNMPPELSLPVQRVLRTMISGVMLVQCFTVYVYLASYIVLLYPVFLEERPTLVLPWLLLAAIRKLLCELISLALGLGTCVLLGPARPPCIKFVITKLASIMPAFYMWTLVFSYYHLLKISSSFKTFATSLPNNNNSDCGLELAVRRRRTKSLQGENELRQKLVASLYEDRRNTAISLKHISTLQREAENDEDIKLNLEVLQPLSVTSNRTMQDIGSYEDWFGNEVNLPRDADRIMEQFVVMLLRISSYLKKNSEEQKTIFNTTSHAVLPDEDKLQCSTIPAEDLDTPDAVGSSNGKVASYVRDYPQIFMKNQPDTLGPITSSEWAGTESFDDTSISQASYASLDSKQKLSPSMKNNTDDITSKISLHPVSIRTSQTNLRKKESEENIKTNQNIFENSLSNEETKSNDSIKKVIDRLKMRTALYDANKENYKTPDYNSKIETFKEQNRSTEQIKKHNRSKKYKPKMSEKNYGKERKK